MIKCPKCHFEQPQDQYCANCGIDILHYIPPSPSFTKKLATSTIFHAVVFVIIVISVITWIQSDRQKEIRSRVAFLQGNPIDSSEQKNIDVQVKAPPIINTKRSQEKLVLNPKIKKTPHPLAKLASTRTYAISKQKVQPPIPKGVSIQFIEIDKTALQSLIDTKGSRTQNFGNLQSTTVPNLSKQLELQSRSTKTLHKTNRRLNSPTHQLFLGVEGTSNDYDIGLTTLLIYRSSESFPLTGEIELLTSFYNNPQDDFPTKESFQENFSLNFNQGLIITGLINPRKLNEDERDLYSQSLLKIFQSEKFLTAQSVFAIILTVHAD